MYWMRLVVDATRGSPGGIDPDKRNPFEWSGGLKHRLPRPSKIHRHEHHAALDYRAMPAHMAIYGHRGRGAADGRNVRADLRRTRPIIEMQVKELDWEAGCGTCRSITRRPPSITWSRCPMGFGHLAPGQVPIDAKPDDLVWPTARTKSGVCAPRGHAARAVCDGLCSRRVDATWFPRLVLQLAGQVHRLQHRYAEIAVTCHSRRAWRLSDRKMLDRRRQMMQAWAIFAAATTWCRSETGGGITTALKVHRSGRLAKGS